MKRRLIIIMGIMLLVTMVFAGCAGDDADTANEEQVSETTQVENSSNGEVSSDEIEWPTKPITLLCGYSAGGSSDLGCRYLAVALEKELGVPIVVENLPGSGSWNMWNQLLHSTATDGYTFGLVNLNMLYGKYDEVNPREEGVDDFKLLANHVIDYQVLAIRLDETRFTDMQSLIEYSQENELLMAAPTVGINSGDATVAKWLTENYGCKITIVPVDGSSDAAAMFLAGDVDFLSANVGDVAEAEANGYKVIVCFADERSTYLPDVPTGKELGYDFISFSARGYAYMQGVDQAIVEKMQSAIAAAFDDPDYQQSMAEMGAELKLYVGDEYTALLDEQLNVRLNIWNIEK